MSKKNRKSTTAVHPVPSANGHYDPEFTASEENSTMSTTATLESAAAATEALAEAQAEMDARAAAAAAESAAAAALAAAIAAGESEANAIADRHDATRRATVDATLPLSKVTHVTTGTETVKIVPAAPLDYVLESNSLLERAAEMAIENKARNNLSDLEVSLLLHRAWSIYKPHVARKDIRKERTNRLAKFTDRYEASTGESIDVHRLMKVARVYWLLDDDTRDDLYHDGVTELSTSVMVAIHEWVDFKTQSDETSVRDGFESLIIAVARDAILDGLTAKEVTTLMAEHEESVLRARIATSTGPEQEAHKEAAAESAAAAKTDRLEKCVKFCRSQMTGKDGKERHFSRRELHSKLAHAGLIASNPMAFQPEVMTLPDVPAVAALIAQYPDLARALINTLSPMIPCDPTPHKTA